MINLNKYIYIKRCDCLSLQPLDLASEQSMLKVLNVNYQFINLKVINSSSTINLNALSRPT